MKAYFSHDEGARNDPKLVQVMMELGHEGKSVYWDLVEMLYEQGGYLMLSQCKGYAFALRTNCDLILRLVNDFGLFASDGTTFWSETALRRLEQRTTRSTKAAESAAKRWGKSERNANALPTHSEGNAIKEKESKEKESKEDKDSSLRSEDAALAAAPSEKKIEPEALLPESPAPQKPPVAKNNNTTGGEIGGNVLTLELWNESVAYTEFIQVGKGAAKTLSADSVAKRGESGRALPETISICLLSMVRKLLTNTGGAQKQSQGLTLMPFELSESVKLSAPALLDYIATFSSESCYSISLAAGQQIIWNGSVQLVALQASSHLFLTLTASFPEAKAATTWRGICECYAPTATSAAVITSPIGGGKPPRFAPPTDEEVLAYMLEQRPHNLPAAIHALAAKWLGHYQANGWKVGRDQMKDWRAACRKWLADVPKATPGTAQAMVLPPQSFGTAYGRPAQQSQVTVRTAAIAQADALVDAMAGAYKPYDL